MRPIHFVRGLTSGFLRPLCGDWGSMASHWTEEAAGVTCDACLAALRGRAPGLRVGPAPAATGRTA